jgi:hypothetical protein
VKKRRIEQSREETMVYVHTNLHLIYMKRKEWLKGKTNMWDVFPDDMGLNGNIELALDNMDINEPILEPVTFDDENEEPLDESSTTPHYYIWVDYSTKFFHVFISFIFFLKHGRIFVDIAMKVRRNIHE